MASTLLLLLGVGLIALGVRVYLEATVMALFIGTGFLLFGVPTAAMALAVLFRRRLKQSDETQPDGIAANETGGMAGALWTAAILNCLTLPGTWVVWQEAQGTEMPIGLRLGTAGLVASVGALFALFAVHRVATYRRLGHATLHLIPSRPGLGQLIAGTVSFSKGVRTLPSRWQLTLKCERFRGSTDANGDREWIGKVVWNKRWEVNASGTCIPIEFVAGDLSPNQASALPTKERDRSDSEAVYWTLEVLARNPLRDYRSFTITIYPSSTD